MSEQTYTEPLDALQAHVRAHGLDLWCTTWGDRTYWKARRGSALVDLGRTPEQLLERLTERAAAEQREGLRAPVGAGGVQRQ